MTTLTKADIVEAIADKIDLDRADIKHLVDETFEEIRKSLENGENVRVSGFGNFLLRDKAVRPGRNPKTGKEVDISARRVVTFKAGQKLRARVENIANKTS
ncbi:MAG: integration host factor subunit alpha [Gammaproteobacteria bacterium]|nr:MAG: integration host factor subunit alpha [Gammaproteobacteria bacterium]